MELPVRALQGRHVRLEPFVPALKAEVRACLDCDPQSWALVSASSQGPAFDESWAGALRSQERGEGVCFAIRRLADRRLVGRSCYLNLRLKDRGLEIGATFLRPEARGGAVNPEAKLLMLAHAFDAGALRVELRTDLLNLRSQAAIAKLGAVREGVLRRHVVTWTGRVRDTVVFSITDEDWPSVRARLERRLNDLQDAVP